MLRKVEQYAAPFGFFAGTVTRGHEYFFLWRYSREDQEAEMEEDEKLHLQRILGSLPASAFAVTSRHGENARFALEVVSQLMRNLGPAVLDDDFGNLWSADETQRCLELDPENTIYSLRNCANKTMQPTR